MNRRAARATRRQTDAAKAAPSREARSGAPFTGQPRPVALRLLTICDALALPEVVNAFIRGGERVHQGW